MENQTEQIEIYSKLQKRKLTVLKVDFENEKQYFQDVGNINFDWEEITPGNDPEQKGSNKKAK